MSENEATKAKETAEQAEAPAGGADDAKAAKKTTKTAAKGAKKSAKGAKKAAKKVETHAFQAEVSQVLDLVIHSLYRNKEIFLRELISNASDALDKLRFASLTDPKLSEGEPLRVRLIPNEEAGVLEIADSGIGMTHDELIENLGTVAHSGTRAFLEQVKKAKSEDVNLIGQFGVGFYSAFLVADRVDVVSRAAGSDEVWRWRSDAASSFTLEPAERDGRGTSIFLHMKEDQQELLSEWKLRTLVNRYSDYVDHPIELRTEQTTGEGDDAKTELVFEAVNQARALWRRPPSEVTDEQYEEMYKHLSHDWEGPLARTHFKIEGAQFFTGLLFVPKRPPFDLFDRDATRGVRLYVKRVLIMDECEDLLPQWLRFMRGVIDSDDLPLNVSRDVLQDSKVSKTIRKQVTKKSLELFEQIAAERPDDYTELWTVYGKVIKEGLHYDPDQSKRLSKLVRFESSAVEGVTSLAEYVERMPEEQKSIYYALGANRRMLESSPHLEALRKRGWEVLYLVDPVDQWAIGGLSEFDEKPLVSAMQADLDLDGDEGNDEPTDEPKDDEKPQLGALTERFAAVLGDRVREVKVSERLAESPVCLVVPTGGLPPHIERLLRANDQEVPPSPRVLELNPSHPIVVDLERIAEQDPESEALTDWIELLYDQALITEGSPVEDPGRFAAALNRLMAEVTHAAAAGNTDD